MMTTAIIVSTLAHASQREKRIGSVCVCVCVCEKKKKKKQRVDRAGHCFGLYVLHHIL